MKMIKRKFVKTQTEKHYYVHCTYIVYVKLNYLVFTTLVVRLPPPHSKNKGKKNKKKRGWGAFTKLIPRLRPPNLGLSFSFNVLSNQFVNVCHTKIMLLIEHLKLILNVNIRIRNRNDNNRNDNG